MTMAGAESPSPLHRRADQLAKEIAGLEAERDRLWRRTIQLEAELTAARQGLLDAALKPKKARKPS
jgi:hypothetical protein